MKTFSKHLLTLLRVALAVGMLYFLISSGNIEWDSFSGLKEHWPLTILAIVLFLIATVLLGFRIRTLVNASDMNLSYWAATKLTFIGLFFNTFLPGSTGGDLVKIYYTSKGNAGRRMEVATIVLMDRVVGLFALITLPLLLAPFFYDLIIQNTVIVALLGTALSVALAMIVGTFIAIKIDVDNFFLFKWLETKVKFGDVLMRVVRTVHSYKSRLPAIYQSIALSWVHQLFMIGVALAIAEALFETGAQWIMVALVPFGYLAIGLPITPGGLGVGEAAMDSLFALQNLEGGAEIILGWRIIMIVNGLIGLAFYLKGGERFVYQDEQKDDGVKVNA